MSELRAWRAMPAVPPAMSIPGWQPNMAEQVAAMRHSLLTCALALIFALCVSCFPGRAGGRVQSFTPILFAAQLLLSSLMCAVRPPHPWQSHVAEQVAAVQAVAQRHGGSGFLFAETEEEKRELWRARKEGVWAAYSLRPGTEPIITVSHL